MSDSDSDPVDSDESEEERAAPQRKRRRKEGASMFVEEEAEDDDDDEEDEEDEDEGVYTAEAAEAEALEAEMEARQRRRQEHNQFDMQRDGGEEMDDILAGIEQRHQRGKQRSQMSSLIVSGQEQAPTHVSRQARLPEVKDPKLFMIKVKTGKEREIVLALMRKSQAMEDQGKPLGISSVVWPGTKGFVYVESMNESSVKEAVKGMRMMMTWSLKWVPVNEMTAVLNITAQKKPIEEKQWVRIKRGVYKGDLGRVQMVMDSGAKALIKLMPRLNFEAMRETDETRRKELLSSRPAQHFFNMKEIEPFLRGDMGRSYEKKRWINGKMYHHFTPFGGNKEMYHRGYLHKEFNVMTMINYTDVQPTLEELQQFRDRGAVDEDDEMDEDDKDTDLADALHFTNRKDDSFGFAKGDTVRVLEGELTNLTAKVLSMNKSTKMVKVRPDHAIIQTKELEFPIAQLMKFIKVGDHVKVINGQYVGETGTVVLVETSEDQWEAIVLTDSSAKEISVFVRDLRESNEVQKELGSLSGYELQDLVMLGTATVGVIVRVGREDFQVLLQKGTVQTCKPQELRGKRNKESQRAVALDSQSNHIQCGDVVVVNTGPNKGHEGTIKRIYRAFLFLHSFKKLENNGMFVVKSRQVVTAGAKSKGASARFGGAFMKSAGPAQKGKGGKGGLDDELCGKTVKLKKGLYKGYIGVVVSATDVTARVEIHSKNKTVKVDKKDLVVTGDRNGEIQDPNQMQGGGFEDMSRTPMVGMQTPINVMATPMHGQATPMHTPLHDGATPMAEDAWDPSVSFTPKHVENYDIQSEDSHASSYGGSSHGGPGGYSTPSMASYQPSTPMSLAATPAPDGLPHTPAASFQGYMGPTTPMDASSMAPTTPMSEAASNVPTTPISAVGGDIGGDDWFAAGMEVLVEGRTGVVKEVFASDCKIYFRDSDDSRRVPFSDISRVNPDKNDKAIVTAGGHEVQRGSTGSLIGVDDADGIVKMDSDLEIKILPMSILAKMAAT